MRPPTYLRENKAEVIWYTHQDDGGNGYLPNGVAICHLVENQYHPYVVWTLSQQPNGEWTAGSGNYCETFPEAVEHYKRRGGKESVPAVIARPRYDWDGTYEEIDAPELDAIIHFAEERADDEVIGLIIAHGFYNESDPDGVVHSIVAFTDHETRAEHAKPEGYGGDPRNYLVTFWQNGTAIGTRYFSNLVEAVTAYAEEYGMDI